MDQKNLCKKIKDCIRHITIVDDHDRAGIVLRSSGTGVVIREDGLILTAAHVVMDEKKHPYLGKILALGSETGGQMEYENVFAKALEVNVGFEDFIKPFLIDLMLLRPKQKQTGVPYLPLSKKIEEVGEMVMTGGFPDDTDLPFEVFDQLNYQNPEMNESQIKKMRKLFRLPLLKHAMIGLVTKINFGGDFKIGGAQEINEKMDIKAAVYWLDNHLTYGGSGGPVVNENGELIGIVTNKAFTASKIEGVEKIPSGTGVSYSHQLITWVIDKI